MQTPCRACIWIWHLAGHVHAHTWYTCPCSLSKRNIIFSNLPQYISWFSLPDKQVAHKIILLVLAFHLLTYSFNIWSCMHVICIERDIKPANIYTYTYMIVSWLPLLLICTWMLCLSRASFNLLYARTSQFSIWLAFLFFIHVHHQDLGN